MSKMFYVYIIYSQSHRVKYIGQTENLLNRLNEHNNGLLSKYTKNKGPWELIHKEEFKTRKEAMSREKYLKTGVGRDWIKKHFNV